MKKIEFFIFLLRINEIKTIILLLWSLGYYCYGDTGRQMVKIVL